MKYEGFIEYLKALGEAHVDIESIVIGDYEDIITRERSDMVYPALWIETPTVRYIGDNDAVREIYQGAIVILQNGSNMDPDIVAQNLKDTFVIAREFLFRIALYENKMSITNKQLDAIATLGNDNDQGWRLSFDIEQEFDETDVCIDFARWTDIEE